ncbi:bifunctional phosphopantothenoylcysteine decarboxylase/phosphopantothenate--cysteine ligase CoaBC [Salisaeta longa]|uniref:bifunctional phosphopantothenoylcysteine decarboxylase/phosphopantothenate--cysteine ligase CoaBC n=1 Tax=Salisaeta longa TaxID=503170 RepID=UPI0003B2EDF6|nr:bifunctional phosphopantothenoylcysteine decarboxylase/phosphopantothenate--cysteine ligase CoaBC [Salisaeta longa]
MALPDLTDRRLLLGVTGSIAAYKAALLVRLLKRAGAAVQVLMTPDAARFIPPLTLGTLSERKVLTEIFPANEDGSWTQHVTLGTWADLFVIAPATAQTIAKLAGGFSDSMLTATVLSANCPLLVCPAMDRDMYQHPATQRNLRQLADYGYHVMPAAHGALASGLVGQGRMPEPAAIVREIAERLLPTDGPLSGQHVLVTAGPTQEPIDPVRHLTNPSTGTMGVALAQAAAARGARVTLVAGPTTLDTPPGVSRVDVRTAAAMHEAVQRRRDTADWVLMAAAVADYTPADPSDRKQKKRDDDLTIRLRRTPDILKTLGAHKHDGQRLLGFALETHDGLAHAKEKLRAKNLDWIVLNNPTEEGAGFGPSTNAVTLLGADGSRTAFPQMDKFALAGALLDHVIEAPHA